jgi:8-oxo-dGTP pyrophosphatase MutT (NUDIX family)
MITFKQFLEVSYINERGCRYWGDAGSGVLPIAKSTGKILVSHRGANVNEGGTFGIFGGGIFIRKYGLKDVDELIKSNIPKEHAQEELREETGYNGIIDLKEIYVYKDTQKGPKGRPCNFYYWNYIGIVPQEFPVKPEASSQWEEGGESGWLTYEELMRVEPKHFGLEKLLNNAGGKIQQLAKQLII